MIGINYNEESIFLNMREACAANSGFFRNDDSGKGRSFTNLVRAILPSARLVEVGLVGPRFRSKLNSLWMLAFNCILVVSSRGEEPANRGRAEINHLVPEEGVFGSYDQSLEYRVDLKRRHSLVFDKKPSFYVVYLPAESIVSVVDRSEDGWFIELVVFGAGEEGIGKDEEKVFERFSAPIETTLVSKLQRVWSCAIQTVRYPEHYSPPPDATTITYVLSTIDGELRSGNLPYAYPKDSLPEAMTKVYDEMVFYVSNPMERKLLRDRLEKVTDSFLMRFADAPSKGGAQKRGQSDIP